MKAKIEAALREAFAPDELEVVDESAQHAGHRGSSGGGHFQVRVVSARFEGKSLLERQRMVYALFDRELRSGEIHALALSTSTPSERGKRL